MEGLICIVGLPQNVSGTHANAKPDRYCLGSGVNYTVFAIEGLEAWLIKTKLCLEKPLYKLNVQRN